jgi:HEAT repeat protein
MGCPLPAIETNRFSPLMKSLALSALVLLAGLFTGRTATTDSASLASLRDYASGGDVTALRRYEQLVAQAVNDPAVRELVEADLIRVLAGPSTYEAIRFACTQLAVIGGAASVPATAALLKDDETVGLACLALASNPAPQAGQALRRSLSRLQGNARVQVVNTLGTRRDTAAVRPLRELIGSGDTAAAGAAYLALGKIASPAALNALAEGRQKKDTALADAVAAGSLIAAEHLLAANRRPSARKIYEELLAPGWPDQVRRGAFEALLRLDADAGEARAAAALAGEEPVFKPSAIAAVATIDRPSATRRFAALLPNLTPSEQALMVESLALRKDPAARRAIEEQLRSPDKAVRLAAIAAVGRSGDAASVPPLAGALLTAKDADELRGIETALAGLSGGDAVDQALAAQLRNRMAGPKAPFLAALARRANPISQRVFLAETAGPDPAMVKLAFQGLSRTAQPDDLAAVLQALGRMRAEAVLEDAQASVGQILRRVEPPARASAAVRAALQSAEGAGAQARFLPLLAYCPDAEGLARVVAAANDPAPEVRDLGLRTLADWPDAAAWEPLKTLYAQAASATERALLLRGLVRLLGEKNAQPGDRLVGHYRELLTSARGDTDRKLILGALAGCPDPQALALAVEQLAQPGVQAEARLAVAKIAEAIKDRHPEAAAAALKKLEGQ